MKTFSEYINEASTIVIKSIQKEPLKIVEVQRPYSYNKGDWLVILQSKESKFYFNRNSWWEIPFDGGMSKKKEYQYGKYEQQKPLSFKDLQAINKLVGLNLI